MQQPIEPKCPDCAAVGAKHVINTETTDESRSGDSSFNIAYCDQCGRIHGVFASTPKLPMQSPAEAARIP